MELLVYREGGWPVVQLVTVLAEPQLAAISARRHYRGRIGILLCKSAP
jgi:hypothetical protein